MSAAAEKDTVWIGFMDIVPVIGTVKEAVELVLALYEGNKAVMKEKEKAIENIVKESLKKDVKKSTLSDKPAASGAAFLSDKPAAASDEFSGLRNVTAVRMGMITEYVTKGSKRETKPPKKTSTEQEPRQKKVEKIKKDTLENIHIHKPGFSEELEVELKEELTRSKRGEHVFNNNILKFHSKVLKVFIEKHQINNLQGYDQHQRAMNELGKHTLPQNTETDIETNMVVHFDEGESYVNANAVVYGVFCRALRKAMLDVLNNINPRDVTQEERQNMNSVIDDMNNRQIYVDQMAKVKWIANIETKQAEFERVRREVVRMYNTDRGVEWCIRILRLVAPLFELRQ